MKGDRSPPGPRRPGGGYRLAGLELARGHLAAALVALKLVRDLLTFVQRAEARTFDGRDVHEDVVAAVIGLDEAEALGGVEPLHGTASHWCHLSGVIFTHVGIGRVIKMSERSWQVRSSIRRASVESN